MLLLGVLLPGFATAHAHLLTAVPADGSTLASAPAQLTLSFSAAGHLTALALRRTGDAAPVPLGALPTASASHFGIALPTLAAGAYQVSWRVLSDDGHVMSGTLRFTLAPH
jgi:methionine-rich copper-binding protein CopC